MQFVWRVLAPLAHAQWVQPQCKVAPRQRIAALTEGVHACAARHQQLLVRRFAIDHALEPRLPRRHLVDFVQHQQRGAVSPALAVDDGPVRGHIEVQVLITIFFFKSSRTRSSK
jgi:hypothetical protein